jgi:hypothetical protein
MTKQHHKTIFLFLFLFLKGNVIKQFYYIAVSDFT